MEQIKHIIKDSGVDKVYENLIKTLFRKTLESDQKKLNAFKGYPTKWVKDLDTWSRRYGIKLVDHSKRDYTMYPLMNQYAHVLGGKTSIVFKGLENVNRKLYGGFTDVSRLQAQYNFFESFKEYSNDFSDITILGSIMDKEIPYYLTKILEEFRIQADKGGMTLKSFIKKNEVYFKEVSVYFSFSSKTDLESLDNAMEELRALISAKKRDALMKANLINGAVDMVFLVVTFGKSIIPEIIEGFEAKITDFSKPIQWVNSLSNFLINKWYLAIATFGIVYSVTKTRLFKLLQGYLAFKIPVAKDYVINDQMLRFFKSYINIMSSETPRGTFEQSIKLVSNDYLRFILSGYVDGSEKDIADSGKSLHLILREIPYIPKEYVDLIHEAEVLGDTESGIIKVINLIEPRVENLSKKLNQAMFWGVLVVTTLLFVFLAALIYQDMMVIMEQHDQEFIDRLQN